MAVARMLVGAVLGLLLGVVITLVAGLALVVATEPASQDPSGLYSVIGVLAWVPLGGLAGLVSGGVMGWRRGRRPRARP